MRRQIDRITVDDVVALATDVGPAPVQVGAVLVLDPTGPLTPSIVRTAVEDRIRGIPRLRQRLVATPFGCGRPVWVDDAAFDLRQHVEHVRCAGAGTEDDLLDVAAEVVTRRLPPDRPLWRLTFVTGLEHDRVALVVAFHHVLADGIGGLAVLADLVDGAPAGRSRVFPQPAPTTPELLFDAARCRLAAVAHLPGACRRVGAALRQLRPASGAGAAPTSLNRPTGPHRRLRVVPVHLDQIHRAAHEHHATVNDVVLATVAGALGALLASRGEAVDRLVVSVPVSARQVADTSHLGNEVGVVPVDIPVHGAPLRRLEETAATMRAAKQTTRAASTAVLGPVFRLLATLRLLRWFINRQHLIHTFITNLRGPPVALTFVGAPISQVLPIAVSPGNVTVSFAALSYAGTLRVTLIADPDTCRDLDTLVEALQAEFDWFATCDLAEA